MVSPDGAPQPAPLHAVTTDNGDIKKVVTKVSDSIKTALSGGKDDDNNEDGGEGGAQ